MALRIEEILDLRSGESLSASRILLWSESKLFRLRKDLEESIQTGKKYLVCACCGSPLKLRAGGGSRYQLHFAHVQDQVECPIKTDCNLTRSEILALKFNGAKESERHIRLKTQIANTLQGDERFSDISVETVLKDITERKKWRKPDVSANFQGNRVVFEIQLSTTFLSVIVERTVFYRENSTPLIWIFDRFDPQDTRYTAKDIFYNNKSNALVFDEQCYGVSVAAKRFHLKVFFQKPSLTEAGNVVRTWQEEIIDFKQLRFEGDTTFFYDGDREERILGYQKDKEKLFDFLRQHRGVCMDPQEFGTQLACFKKYDIDPIIDSYSDLKAVSSLFSVFFSLKEDEVFGFRYKNDLQLVNYIFDHQNEYFHFLVEFLRNSGIEARVLSQDRKGTYRGRVEQYFERHHFFNDRYRGLLRYFFAEIRAKVE